MKPENQRTRIDQINDKNETEIRDENEQTEIRVKLTQKHETDMMD